MQLTSNLLSSFYNRYYKSSYGTQAATWMFNTVKSVAYTARGDHVNDIASLLTRHRCFLEVVEHSKNLESLTVEDVQPRRLAKAIDRYYCASDEIFSWATTFIVSENYISTDFIAGWSICSTRCTAVKRRCSQSLWSRSPWMARSRSGQMCCALSTCV